MKFYSIITNLILGLTMTTSLFSQNSHEFSFIGSNNNEIKLSDFKGKVIMIVNTASKCGFTEQYEDLEKLHEKYEDKGLRIIAVPSNDFGNQEPGSDKEIQKFCKINYGVSFPVVKKEHVKGSDAHPFYKYAREKLGFLSAPKWNFHKYLINKKGEIVEYYFSTTSPTNKKVTDKIEILLDEEVN